MSVVHFKTLICLIKLHEKGQFIYRHFEISCGRNVISRKVHLLKINLAWRSCLLCILIQTDKKHPRNILECLVSVCLFKCAGLQRVHDSRDESAARTVTHSSYHSQGDRAHGADHTQEVLLHPDAAEAEHLRGSHDPPLQVPGRQVRSHTLTLVLVITKVGNVNSRHQLCST